ncbi:MAG: Na+/H+ antiporter NhaC family protein, partial [Bacillota bacterium]|nr:Na+/H+ antiporter NhaC family protein [Bacillota bacterium]
MESYGIISVLPVLVILVIAITTRKTLFAMVCGLSTAAIILTPSIKDLPGTWVSYMQQSMSNESMQWLVLIIAMFGILIALFEKSGAIIDFGNWAGRFIKNKRQAQVVTMLLGIVIFLEDYLNNLTVGTTMKKITDKHGIPRSELALIVNGMAAPVCLLIPLSSWAVYYAQLLEDQNVTVNGSGTGAYLHCIPYSFYPMIMVIIIALLIFGLFPKIGTLRKDNLRCEETGNVMPVDMDPIYVKDANDEEAFEDGYNLKPWGFLIPLVIMIVVTIAYDIDILTGSIAGVISAIIIYLVTKRLSFTDILKHSFEGLLDMGFVFVLTALAFGVSTANTDLGLAEFVISVTEPIMHGGFLPAVTFIVCGVYAYATGCFWDLAVIITPIVIPLSIAMGVDPILTGAALFSGTAFGSNTCLYGDGVILCAQGCGIRP